ncbi:pirin family protein [Pendulispora rubella]|uniref:Pirin family protein n=1 Tax=Pendulispora rubella TaxID=2741070 RepID=A0ABZ2KVQ9_9BACT
MAKEVERIITGRVRDIGDFDVRRILPYVQRRHIGPYVFVDHMGPAQFEPGRGMDVRPHPHIGLATMTYLLEGRIRHRDSLGSDQEITPGAINWMTAGRGIVHSERTPAAMRNGGMRLHGLQVWIALRTEDEECAPDFQHYPAEVFADVKEGGATVRVLVGSFYGASSPVKTRSRLFYGDARLAAGSSLPMDFAYEEAAAYIVSGAVRVGDVRVGPESMVVFSPGEKSVLHAEEESRVMLLGGDCVDGPRHIEWNFVSSSRERIEQAKREWRARSFPVVPGDSEEFIPLPE